MLRYIFIILSLPLILVFIWFKDGYLLGHAEGALPFYNLERYLEPTNYAWMEHPGLGNISLLTTSAKPTYIFLTFLQGLDIPGFIIQAGVFYFLLTSAGIGIYLLTKEFFPKLDNKYLLLSVFFYWFNPLSISEIWNRFLLNYIFFFGALPVFLLIFIKGLRSKRYYFASILTLFFGVYSYSMSSLVFVLLLWLLFILFALFFLITEKDKINRWFYIKFVSFLLILFIFTNSWWITQLFSLKYQMSFTQTISNFSSADNLQTLQALSNKLGNLTNVVRLINASSSEIIGLDWINFFNSPVAVFFEFFIVGTILFTVIKKRSEKSILVLGGILFITLFLIKGTSSPLGELYQLFFQRFSFLQAFRNPFEKFSFILNLIIALLVGYSLSVFSQYVTTKTKNNIFSAMLYFFSLCTIIIMGYYFFSGLVFTSNEPPTNNPNIGYEVKVPDYYKEASDFMESKGKNFRFIGFPLGDEGITYKWEKGYTGVELPSTLFSTPGILFNTAVPYYSDIVPKLENLLLKNDSFLSVANSLNIRFLLLRTDIDWQERNMKNPQVLLQRISDLENKGLIKKIGQYGALTLWENLSWKDITFYSANKIISSLPEIITSYNIPANTTAAEATIQSLSESITNINLLTKIVINPIQVPNPKNLDYEIYSIKIPIAGDYQIQFENLSNTDPKIFIDKKLISIDNKPLTTLDPIHLNEGEYQILINNLEGENIIDPSKASDLVGNKGYFKNFQINNFDSGQMYNIYLGKIPTLAQDITLFIFQDNDKFQNGENITSLKQELLFSTFDKNTLNNLAALKLFFIVRPSSNAAWISLLSKVPLDLSAVKDIAVKKLTKPRPFLVYTNINHTKTALPGITYKKIDPTKYTIHVSNATDPFVLVFSGLFNNKWEAVYADNVPLTQHFRTNSYANGWFIDKKGNFDLTVEFTPQRLFRIGGIISLISHLLNGSILVFLLIKEREVN